MKLNKISKMELLERENNSMKLEISQLNRRNDELEK